MKVLRRFSPAGAAWPAALCSLLCAAIAQGAGKNPVADWNELLTLCIAKECQTPALASRNLATFHLAVSAALDATQGRPENDKFLAGAAAAAAVGKLLFAGEDARFDALLPKGKLSDKESALVETGRRAAAEAMDLRRGDNETSTVNYSTSFKPGQWRRTSERPPELPHWRKVKTFVLENPRDFLPAPPPALDSPQYAAAVHEVQALGAADSAVRTPEQTMLAKFWSDFSYTSTPPGHWNEVARFLVRQRSLNAEESARLFAALNVAMADVSIVCWKAKYEYNFWRPVTAIRLADDDGNSATHGYAEWKPLLKTPPHPDYVSGHAAFSGAAARVMEEFFGAGTEFRVTSETVSGVERTYTSFAACAREIAESRVFGGIHYRFSGEAGLAMGQAAAEAVLNSLGAQKFALLSVREDRLP